MLGLRSTRASKATADASVTIASCTPRMRRAGADVSRPSSVATSAARTHEIGKGTPQSPAIVVMANAAIPARAICIKEICPRNPTTTTSERATATPMSELINAPR